MGHSYWYTHVHCVFSTKDRRKVITSDLQHRLYAYLGGIAKSHGIVPVAIGGVEDHVHMLLAVPATLSVAKAIQLLKGGSSKWVHDTFR